MSKSPNYNHLYHFHIIASAGSLTAAAEELQLAQSTLSEQVKQLEKSFDTRLFIRDSSGLRLNDAGKKMYRFTRLMFRTGQRLVHAFDPSRVEDKLTLDVGVSSSISRSFAAEYFIPLFEEERTLIRIRHGDFEYLLHSLVSHEIDLLLGDQKPNDPEDKGLHSETLQQTPLHLVAATAKTQFIDAYPNNLSDIPLITYSPQSNYRWEVDQYYQKLGAVPNIIGEVDDVLIIKSAVEQGICCAALPSPVTYSELRKKQFTLLDTLSPDDSRTFITYHKQDPYDHVLRAINRLKTNHKMKAD